MSGIQETFQDRVIFVILDFDDKSLNDTRQQLGITAQAQYVLVSPDGEIVQRWFGRLNREAVEADIEQWIQT